MFSGFGLLTAARMAGAGHHVHADMRDLNKRALLRPKPHVGRAKQKKPAYPSHGRHGHSLDQGSVALTVPKKAASMSSSIMRGSASADFLKTCRDQTGRNSSP